MYIIESWWRHNSIWDRQDASGILYEDCDCPDEAVVERYAKNYVSQIIDY